ncbi:hypothetical protein SISSUDRAFT_1069955 [Sistotremastrum suecicum HHB10207 ss-3]|uniref:Nudix hydrolase domain-containing protein n=1 Tax=Sistotremastrum suecicum HHB10207 ss-3 TaxID=1314776 RepID=A0A166G3T8_9AGAM|nr:hypothetical protein SISSUDRAFT_1069955 [Sistotremastrum suecicum HHB10207 ss-3]
MTTASSNLPQVVLDSFSERSIQCIERLQAYEPEPFDFDLSQYPPNKTAAVLILLFERDSELQVLLTTRSKSLRSHPGQTALPGGKVDDTDESLEHTALREAFEEVALPLNSPHVHTISRLRPFLSLYKLLVTPIVAVLTDPGLLEHLVPQESEVDCIFSHPLYALLDPSIMSQSKQPLAELGGPDWPYETEFHNTSDSKWLHETLYRMHRFRSTNTPIKGLTSDILLLAAQIAYGRGPAFERWAPGQLISSDAIRASLHEWTKKGDATLDESQYAKLNVKELKEA